MRFKELEKNRYFIMLEKGEEIIEQLTKFIETNKIILDELRKVALAAG